MKKIITLIFISLFSSPAFASPNNSTFSGVNAVSNNQAVNTQTATGTVNQSPVGGVNSNYQINNSQATDYGFAPGIYCRGANFSVGGYGSGSNANADNGFNTGASNFGAIALFTIPIGSSISESCKELAKEITRQRKLDTAYNLIKVCSALKKENISVNYEVFPDFKVCEAVSVSNSQSTSNLGRDPFSPKDNTTITVPVR